MKSILFFLVIIATSLHCSAQIDTIRIDKSDLITSNLKAGLHQYLVYFENPAKKRIGNSSIWNRQVNFKSINGRDVIEIEQFWYMTDTLSNRYVYSISDKKNICANFSQNENAWRN
jgi:hypothetical protein